jgi:hypothetical protein
MSDYDDILQLEDSDLEGFGEDREVRFTSPPEKKRRILEESIPESLSDERIVTLLPSTLKPPTPNAIPFAEYVLASHNSATRANIYKSRVHLIYPAQPVQETRTIRFIPSDDEEEDEDTEIVDHGVQSLVEDEDQYGRATRNWPAKYKLGPTPVQSFVNIQWNDKLGREFAENDLPNHDPTMMVEILKPEALHLISRAGPYFVDPKVHGKFQVYQVKSGETINPEVLEEFLLTVHAWRVLCFDTESDQTILRYNVEPNKGKIGRTPVVFGNPAGQVLIFHDARQTPLELVKICADFRYMKIQSGIENDIRMLQSQGFAFFRGLVDVQTLITLVRPDTKQCGIEFCTQYVWGSEAKKDEKLRVKWTKFFNGSYHKEEMKDLSLKHSIQDVLTPVAILVKIGLEIADLRKDTEDPSENIFYTMNEALELCVSKAPADIRNTAHDNLVRDQGEAKLMNWISDGAVDYCTPFQFNSHYLVHRIRRSRADLIEYHYPGLSWDEVQNLALLHIDLLRGRMPFSNELNYLDLRFHIMDHCAHCGSLDHRSDDCSEQTVPCCYEHGPDIDFPTHSIICCPALHAYCKLCHIRGHLAEAHGKGWKSAAQLRRLFLENAPRGLFTSLLFLIRTDLTAANILPHHFRLGLSGRRLVQSYGDYWLYGGLGRISAEEKARGKRYRETSRRNLLSTPTTYESLNFVSEQRTNEQKAKAILVEQGVITDPKKRLSGSQRRKRRKLTLELDAKDKAAQMCLE